jgi:glutamate racemase
VQPKIKIGVFDSGVGGLSVVRAIQKQVPQLEVVFKNDEKHVPYGTRSIEEIYSFVKPIIQDMVDEDCRVIVVACNTVTTNLIKRLRDEFAVPLVGMEPMVKPAAALTESKVIAVCATPRTLTSDRYRWLKDTYAKGVEVLEPDCSDWSAMIEGNNVDRDKVTMTVDRICSQGADVIVLGCTHYHWIEDLIKKAAAGRAKVLQPEVPVIDQLNLVLSQLA